MISAVDSKNGLPRAGAFGVSANLDQQGQPLGTYAHGKWHVAKTVNRTTVVEGQPYRVFETRPTSYDAMFRLSVAGDANREAVVCGDRRLTYGELDAMIERTAHGFITAGLQRGERVAVMLDNRLEYLVAILACVRAGGIAIPLGTRLGPVDVAYIIDDAAPAFAVTAPDWLEKFPEQGSLRRIFVVGAESNNQDDFGRLLLVAPVTLPALQSDDIMMIVYTSGTTGKPKGACLTHLNFVHTCLHYLYALAIDAPQRSLLAVPATHIAGFGPLASVTLASGGTIVMVREFKTDAILALMEKERITYAVFVPSMYQLLVMKSAVKDFDLSHWKYGIYGGAIMPPAVIERFSEIVPALRMINAYGATETCAVCTIMPAELTTGAPGSVGFPLECDDIIIVDENGHELPNGEHGELWVRGPNVSPGYWNNEAATHQAFVNGFWKSGDVGMRDSSGLLYIVDRLKDMINRGGFKVFSAEVENAIMTESRVEDCAVVGVPDPVLGEKTFAFVKRRDANLTAADLNRHLRERIADYKIPDFWMVGDQPVPRNQNGKVQKKDVYEVALGFLGCSSCGQTNDAKVSA